MCLPTVLRGLKTRAPAGTGTLSGCRYHPNVRPSTVRLDSPEHGLSNCRQALVNGQRDTETITP